MSLKSFIVFEGVNLDRGRSDAECASLSMKPTDSGGPKAVARERLLVAASGGYSMGIASRIRCPDSETSPQRQR